MPYNWKNWDFLFLDEIIKFLGIPVNVKVQIFKKGLKSLIFIPIPVPILNGLLGGLQGAVSKFVTFYNSCHSFNIIFFLLLLYQIDILISEGIQTVQVRICQHKNTGYKKSEQHQKPVRGEVIFTLYLEKNISYHVNIIILLWACNDFIK